MNNMEFVKGLGIGVVAGATIGMTLAPRKKNNKSMAGKAIKAAGEIVENITDAIGM